MQDLQIKIGYEFQNADLLEMALTHASTASGITYERLEFLGDRVLGMAVADTLYKKFPNEPEGDLARRLAALVQGATLAEIARELKLGKHILLSESERGTGGDNNDHILADVMEAILGAMYLDGGFEACQSFIKDAWGNRFYDMTEPPQHPKTTVQEWAQSQGLPLPQYEITGQTGPDHAPIFEITLTVKGHDPVVAEGKSRQEAEKRAASILAKKLSAN